MEDLTADQIAELIGDDCEPLEDALTGGEMATLWRRDVLRNPERSPIAEAGTDKGR